MHRSIAQLVFLWMLSIFMISPALAEDEFLEPEQAFQFSARLLDQTHLEVTWKSAKGYYLYRDKINVTVKPEAVKAGSYQMPQGVSHEDEVFGKQIVYPGMTVRTTIPLDYSGAKPAQITVSSKFQGCADAGVCYPPMTKNISLNLASAPAAGSAAATATPAGAATPASSATNALQPASAAPASEQDQFAQILRGNLLTIVGLFFLAGLALAFTPCVFPMIPILSAILVGQGERVSTGRAFGLSLSYVLGMALTYTVIGMIAGVTGAYLQAFFQNPWVLVGFSIVFVLLALSMFGFYNLQVPASLQARLSGMGKGGSTISTFVMGILSALIVGPCVAAPLAGALLYISQTGDVVLGGISLFALSMGMGTPLLLIGASAGKLLPRAGGWMDAVKYVFGVLLLAVAIWMLSRILPAWATMSLWAALLIISAIFLRVLDSLPHDASGWVRFGKGVGVLLMAYGLLLGLGAVTGAKDPLRPLEGIAFGGGSQTEAVAAPAFQSVSTPGQLRQALASAQGKPVLLDFYADWCVECVRMENTTFRDPQVREALANFKLLRADVTENNAEQRALLKEFQLVGPPAILFFDPKSQEIRNLRLVGYKNAADFLQHLTQVNSSAGK